MLLHGHDQELEALSYSPDGAMLASAGGDARVRLWDASTGRAIGEPFAAAKDRVAALAFAPAGDVLAAGSWDGNVRLYRVADRSMAGVLPPGARAIVRSLAYLDDRRLVVGYVSGGAVLWSAGDGTWQPRPLPGSAESIGDVASDRKRMRIAGASGRTVSVWNLETEPAGVEQWISARNVTALAFDPAGRLHVGLDDGTIRGLDPETIEEVSAMSGHGGRTALSLAVDASGAFLA
jgi:WD40 repeat protein